ncbi:tRNA (uracil(54)-C(5))-methyltransferase -like protein-B [Halotydeus destructor]|nr:tRNA (uracil(54)-C(5))-methyltransferase -like protein-B [Halotydeus destructor]
MNSLIRAFKLSASIKSACRHRPELGHCVFAKRFHPRGTIRTGSIEPDSDSDEPFDRKTSRQHDGDSRPSRQSFPNTKRPFQRPDDSSSSMQEFDSMESELDQRDGRRNQFNQRNGYNQRGGYNNYNQGRGGYNNYNQGRGGYNNYSDNRGGYNRDNQRGGYNNYGDRGGYNQQPYQSRGGFNNNRSQNLYEGAARPMGDIIEDEEDEQVQRYQQHNRARGGYVNRARGGYNGNYNNSNSRDGYRNQRYGNDYRPSRDGYDMRQKNMRDYLYPPKQSDEFPFKDISEDLKELEEVEAATDSATGVKPKKQHVPLPFEITPENRFEVINRVMCPIHHVVYDNQLKRKYNTVKLLLKELALKLRNVSPAVADNQGLPCPLEFVKRSPMTVEYRNKDEFSIWPGIDGNRKTVGFFVGEPSRHSNVICVEPDNLIISKKSHRALAKLFQNYLRDISPLEVCTNFAEGGHWRRFIVRSNNEGEHMVICQFHPQDLSAEQLDEEKTRLTAFWKQHESEHNLKSVYMQPCPGTRMSNEEAPFQLLFGEPTITETVLGKKFFISPESFFQVNTSAAEVLYQTVLDEVCPTPDMTLIDLCAGTGTVSTLLGPLVKRVIAIEQSSQAVEDAKRNAAFNNVRNVTFINGKAEEEMPKLLDSFFGQNVVVVANPARSGLRPAVISTLREMNHIEKVVYISCKPGGDALKNFVHLSLNGSNRVSGTPLVPVNATPVDLFPQTLHCELVLTLERFMSG